MTPEPESFGADGILCKKETAIGEKAIENFPLGRCKGLKSISAGHVEKRAEEKIRIRKRYNAPIFAGVDARPKLELLEDGSAK